MNNIATINNHEVTVKEYAGHRVVTFKDIDLVHERPEGTAGRNFRANRERLIEGEDYFRVSADEIRRNNILTISDKNYQDIVLLTESGYLMLVKSFTDDLAWTVQRQLVKTYFAVKNGTTSKQQSTAKKKRNLSATTNMIKTISGILKDAGVNPTFIAAEAKRLYKEQADIDIQVPLITDSTTQSLWDCTSIARELGIFSKSGRPHDKAVSAIIQKLDIFTNEIVRTAYSRNGHDGVTVQYKRTVLEKAKEWLEENNYPAAIAFRLSNGEITMCRVVYQEVA